MLMNRLRQLAAITKPRRQYSSTNSENKITAVEEAVNNLLYNTPLLLNQTRSRKILSCLVSNEPGVLSRVSGVLASRGFNIDSLVTSATNIKDLSRMTIVLHENESVVEQAKKQLEDLVPVWAVLDYSEASIVERELLLVRVQTKNKNQNESQTDQDIRRQSIVELTRLFDGRIVDMARSIVTVELSAKKARIDAFLALMEPYGILEAVRSGLLALPRTPVDRQSTHNQQSSVDKKRKSMDATLLPPG